MVRGTEARKWLENVQKKMRNRQIYGGDVESLLFAANHFGSLDQLEHAVNSLYKRGAIKITLTDDDKMFIVLPSSKKKLLTVMEYIVQLQPDEFGIIKSKNIIVELWWD